MKGFTLIECLITMTLTVILLFATLISYRDFITHNQLPALVNQLTDALDFARNSAITEQTGIIFCPKGKNNACGLDWQNGQIILIKSTQMLLRELPSIPPNYHFYWRSTLGESSNLQWRSDGFTDGQQGSFFICGQSQAAQIIVLRTGRWRVVEGADVKKQCRFG